MKFPLSQMIAIVCILAVGVMTVTPFVPSVDAHAAKVWWNYHLIVCSEYDGHYYTYCDHVLQLRLGWEGLDTPHPHEQVWGPDEYSSELKTVNNCNDCNL